MTVVQEETRPTVALSVGHVRASHPMEVLLSLLAEERGA
jgi:hypothetical protein